MESAGTVNPSTLSVKDLPWQIMWNKEKCTLCGRCTAVCPVRAIEPGVHRKRALQVPVGLEEKPAQLLSVYFGIDQRTVARMLRRLRHVHSGLSQRRHHAGACGRNRQTAVSRQPGRRAPQARRTAQCSGQRSG